MNRKVIWFIELFMWLVVFIGLSVLAVYVHSYYEQKTNSYYLFFTDVDGLMKGSPVRLMGMQIGFVQEIKTFDDSVFVSFLVTKDNVVIPEKSVASVEFYGLGGSKSLEIVPDVDGLLNKKDGKTKDEDIIITKEPYRIQDFYDVQSGIAKSLVQIGNSFTSIVPENQIYKLQTQLKFSSKLKEVNKCMFKAQGIEKKIELDENCLLRKQKVDVKKIEKIEEEEKDASAGNANKGNK